MNQNAAAKRCRCSIASIPTSTAAFTRIKFGACSTFSAQTPVWFFLSEELRNDHKKTLRRVFEFLGVDSSFVPPEASVFEQEYSIKIDNQLRSRLIDIFYFDIKELEKLTGRNLADWYEAKSL